MIYIVIILAGMIGAGKTSYTERMADTLGTQAFFEPVDDNPILDKYYENQERYGFSLQIYFLNKRFRLIKEAYGINNNVLDRSIYEDALFTKINLDNGNITKEEYEIYLDLLDNMMEEIEGLPKKAPDLLVYLDGSFEKILSNIKRRGRSYEQPTESNGLLAYYKQLHGEYENWYQNYNYSPKIRINIDKYNIVDSEEDWETVYGMIVEKLKELKVL